MPLFNCSRCGAIENTALGAYWNERRRGEPVLCSECATGKWHGEFPKEQGEIPPARRPSGDRITPEWCAEMAKHEIGHEVGAGRLPLEDGSCDHEFRSPNNGQDDPAHVCIHCDEEAPDGHYD